MEGVDLCLKDSKAAAKGGIFSQGSKHEDTPQGSMEDYQEDDEGQYGFVLFRMPGRVLSLEAECQVFIH